MLGAVFRAVADLAAAMVSVSSMVFSSRMRNP
jgi:hypothetical protein